MFLQNNFRKNMLLIVKLPTKSQLKEELQALLLLLHSALTINLNNNHTNHLQSAKKFASQYQK